MSGSGAAPPAQQEPARASPIPPCGDGTGLRERTKGCTGRRGREGESGPWATPGVGEGLRTQRAGEKNRPPSPSGQSDPAPSPTLEITPLVISTHPELAGGPHDASRARR